MTPPSFVEPLEAVALRQALAPTGALRAAINLGNPLLARQDASSNVLSSLPRGISVDLAQALANQLGVPLVMEAVLTAGAAVQQVATGAVDIGFFAVDPARAQGVRFTKPYVWIEGAYAVPDRSPITCNEAVDDPGHRIVVGKDSAYDLYLTRHLQNATLVRALSSQRVVQQMVEEGLEVAAGVRQQLEVDIAKYAANLRILPGRFMVIEQAMGLSTTRGDAALAFLEQYVQTQKSSGFVQAAIERHKVTGVTVAEKA